VLICLGALIYYQFKVSAFAPLTNLVGGLNNAVYILSGLPVMTGVLSLGRTFSRRTVCPTGVR
jgi:hypothetical protein